METFVKVGLEILESRFQEIDTIIAQASDYEVDESTDISQQGEFENIYKVLCRSAQVLLIAHLEGAIKDTAKNILDDINYFSRFTNSPYSIKKTFCEHFLVKNEKGKYSIEKTKLLIDTFDSLPVKYIADPFIQFYNSGSSKNNRNPSPNLITKVTEKFGVMDFFIIIKDSDLDVVFTGSKSEILTVRDRLKEHLYTGVSSYPYDLDLSLFNISSKTSNEKNTLWHLFLESILKSRHDIAHGNTLESPFYHKDIEESKLKVEILLYAFISVLCVNSLSTC